MIEISIVTSEVVKGIFQNICVNYSESIIGKVIDYSKNQKISSKIEEMAEFFSNYENTNGVLFLSDLQAAFSKENIREILKRVYKNDSFDMEMELRNNLVELCERYNVLEDGQRFIENIIQLFIQATYECNPELAKKLFCNRIVNQNDQILQRTDLILNNLSRIENEILSSNSWSLEIKKVCSQDYVHIENGSIVGDDEDLFSWNLSIHHTMGLFGNNNKRKTEVLDIIEHWKKEREQYPGWFIAPVRKREDLSDYTRDEALLWKTSDLSFQDKFDFTYELVWRYETGMDLFTQPLQKNIYLVWKDFYDMNDWSNQRNNEKWFYIGQSLLRDYREDMNWDAWQKIFNILEHKNDIMEVYQDELSIEFIKQLFYRMQISDVRDKIQQHKCSENRYAVRLQKCGIMAECGLLSEAHNALNSLIADLLKAISALSEENNRGKVYLGSILSCSQELMSFVIQAIYPFDKTDELKQIWRAKEDSVKFFNFEDEKHQWNNNLYKYYCKHKEEAFELNRNVRTTIWVNSGFKNIYGFYRVLDRMAMPLHLGMIRLLPYQEIEFIAALVYNVPYLGCFMLLRTGNDKVVKTIVSRRLCISLGFEWCRKLFDYTYQSLEQNTESIRVNNKRGNAYTHVLMNGLEILRRFVSVSSFIQQKKLVMLMCKLIDADIVHEIRVMDEWIKQVMGVIDEKIKAQYLNEFLMSSTKDRYHIKDDRVVDPFEVISSSVLAKKYYEEASIDSILIDKLIERAKESEEDRRAIVPRLNKLHEWNLLSKEQLQGFCELIWNNIDEKTGLPNYNQYYAAVFVDWPAPKDVDVATLLRNYIMNPDWYEHLKSTGIEAVTMGTSRIFDEINCLNGLYPNFLSFKDKEIILGYFVDYWTTGKEAFERNENKGFYLEEFLDRYQALEKVIGGFSIDSEQIEESLRMSLKKMLDEMRDYGINTLEAQSVLCKEGDILRKLGQNIINQFYSDEKGVIHDATNAAENIIKRWPESEVSKQLLLEQIRLIRYGRQPGLHYFFVTIHNLAYLDKLHLSDDLIRLLNKALVECAQHTSYDKLKNKTEKEIKEYINLRCACARTAYQLSKHFTESRNFSCVEGVEMWKKICIGSNSKNEFAEVKRAWI